MHIDSEPSAGVAWWRRPVTTGPYRRTAYILIAPLADLLSLVLSVASPDRAARLQQRVAAGLLLSPRSTVRAAAGRVRDIGWLVVVLVVDLVAFGLTVYLWLLVASNFAYPLRPGDVEYETAWGGPTLAGAWLLHAAAGLIFLLIIPWLLATLTKVQARSRRPLWTERTSIR